MTVQNRNAILALAAAVLGGIALSAMPAEVAARGRVRARPAVGERG